VLEFGAQDLCATPEVVEHILVQHGFQPAVVPTRTAQQMYARLGFDLYLSIDATGDRGSLVYDLNRDLRRDYGYSDVFDVVTNLGTAEHCFNQYQVFKNMHDVCRPGGLMIHAAPCAGNVNHGFYNYHPRLFADLAAANNYKMVRLDFTVDYTPRLHRYHPDTFKRYDTRDLLLYVVFERIGQNEFKMPFDGMFASESALRNYVDTAVNPLATDFAPYLKGGSWQGTTGDAELPWWKRGPAKRAYNRIRNVLLTKR
jgi:SAM-dependent methyltransferase